MGGVTLREKYRQDVRGAILEAAREAFLRVGPEAVSMRGLAKAIGYSPGTIYLHFKDKQELLFCVVEESFAKLLETLQEVRGGDGGVSLLKHKLRVYVNFGLQYPHHYHFAFMMKPAVDARSQRSVPHPAFDELRNAVRDCIERGHFRCVDVETTSQALWATVHGITSLLITRPEFPWTDKVIVIDHVIDIAVEGLCAIGARTKDPGEHHVEP